MARILPALASAAISRSGRRVKLASRCSVHCKSEATHKLNKGECSPEDIAFSLIADRGRGLPEAGSYLRTRGNLIRATAQCPEELRAQQASDCYPGELMYAEVDDLLEQGVDCLFLPSLRELPIPAVHEHGHLCQVVRDIAGVIRSCFDACSSKILSPEIGLSERLHSRGQLFDSAQVLQPRIHCRAGRRLALRTAGQPAGCMALHPGRPGRRGLRPQTPEQLRLRAVLFFLRAGRHRSPPPAPRVVHRQTVLLSGNRFTSPPLPARPEGPSVPLAWRV
jgi:hypothetical protein